MNSDQIRKLMRTPKAQLEQMVIDADAQEAAALGRTQRWVVGGPATWSKDELIAYLVRREREAS